MSVTWGLTGRPLIASVFQVTSVLHGDRWHIGNKIFKLAVKRKKQSEILCYLSMTNKTTKALYYSVPRQKKVFYARLIFFL